MKIYNTLGQQLSTLFDVLLESGMHTANWNTVNQPSGIYIVQLKVDNALSTTRILVQK